MAKVITMPRLSDTMEEGTVAIWHKKIGDEVASGDLLAEIETDKATMEFEAFEVGTLLYIGVEEGKTAPVDSILAIVGEKGEDVQPLIDQHQLPTTKKEEASKPSVEAEKPIAENVLADIPKPPVESKEPLKNSVQTATASPDRRVKASPLAKAMAKEKNINLSQVSGTGPEGRIIKKDIENFVPPTTVSNTPALESKEVAISQMRKTIAKRLTESKFTAPHFYLNASINVDKLIEARKDINNATENRVSFNDFVVKAVSLAIKKHPEINSSFLGDRILYHGEINVGVAVAVDEGLLVPVLRNTDQLSLTDINAQVKNFAQKAKAKELQPSDWEGSTFTISNLGMFGIDNFTAIINSPNAAILAVGMIQEVPIVKNNEIVPGNIMKVSLSCDHRVIDGAIGAAFLQTLKSYLESPVLMI